MLAFIGAELIKTHAHQRPGGRATDYDDYPKERAPYAMRYPDFYRKKAREIGPSVGEFSDRLLAGEFPWSRLRQAQKLLRLTERYGSPRTEAACQRALSFDLIDVYRLERILKQPPKSPGQPHSKRPWLQGIITIRQSSGCGFRIMPGCYRELSSLSPVPMAMAGRWWTIRFGKPSLPGTNWLWLAAGSPTNRTTSPSSSNMPTFPRGADRHFWMLLPRSACAANIRK